MEIYDYVPAGTLEDTDQMFYQNDYVELNTVIDSGDSIMVKGYSHVSGDAVCYIIHADTEVGLWAI